MDFIASLFQQDMFFAVVSYLTVGLIFLAYFRYREKKWEHDLEQYRIKDVKPAGNSPKMRTAEIYVLNRNAGKAPSQVSTSEEEMQVVAGETMTPESQEQTHTMPSKAAQ